MDIFRVGSIFKQMNDLENIFKCKSCISGLNAGPEIQAIKLNKCSLDLVTLLVSKKTVTKLNNGNVMIFRSILKNDPMQNRH